MFEAAIGLVAGFMVAGLLLLTTVQPNSVIIEKGYGLYCPDNGKFAFTGECQ
jgi:hypothetical protein